MKICPKCNENHEKPGMYCSRKCANSRIFSKDSRLKKSIANKEWFSKPENKEKHKIQNLLVCKRKRITCITTLMETSFETLSYERKRKRVFIEQNGNCLECNINSWKNKPITLELDHIDGNNKNNDRSNLRGLCPNCHSQTPTWKGRNNTGKKNSYYTSKSNLWP